MWPDGYGSSQRLVQTRGRALQVTAVYGTFPCATRSQSYANCCLTAAHPESRRIRAAAASPSRRAMAWSRRRPEDHQLAEVRPCPESGALGADMSGDDGLLHCHGLQALE